MKAVVLFYIIGTILYFWLADGSYYVGLFNMLIILGSFSAYMFLSVQCGRPLREDREWIAFAIVMTVTRCIYTTACPHAPIEWIYNMNKIFAGIFALWLMIKIATKLYRGYSTYR